MLYLCINNITSHQLCENRSKPLTGALFRIIYLDKHPNLTPQKRSSGAFAGVITTNHSTRLVYRNKKQEKIAGHSGGLDNPNF